MLLVEDDASTRALLASELEREGFVVAEACDGEEGLREVARFRPDVVVLDLMLPRLNGFAVARAVRALERPPGVGIVAVTGLAAEALRAEALGAGCDVVLTKPVRVAMLVERVRECCLRRGRILRSTRRRGWARRRSPWGSREQLADRFDSDRR